MLPKRYINIIFKMMWNVLLPQPWQSLWVHLACTGDTHVLGTGIKGVLYFWAPQFQNNQRDSSWQATNPRALNTQQIDIPSVFLWERPIVLELQPVVQASGLPHIWRLWKCVRERWAGRLHLCTSLRPSYSLPVPPRKALIHSSGVPVSATVAKGTSPDHLMWRPVGFKSVVPQNCISRHTVKAAACLASKSLRLGAEIPHSGTLIDPGTP